MTKAKKPISSTKSKAKAKIEDAVVIDKATKADADSDDKTGAVESQEETEPDAVKKETSDDTPAENAIVKTQGEKRKSVFVPMLFGGLVSGAIGFGAATYYFMNQPSKEAQVLKSIQETVGKQQASLDKATTSVASMSEAIEVIKSDTTTTQAMADLTKSSELKYSDLTKAVSDISNKIADIDTRMTTLEKRPVTNAGGMTSEAAAAYERELQSMRALLETQKRDIEKIASETTARIKEAAQQAKALEQNADATAKSAAQKVALSQLKSALDNGAAFEGPLSNLAATENVEIAQVLKDTAKTGVPTLASLQEGFPDAARAALAASIKATSGDGVMDKLGSFFQSQVGGRSLEPRQGDDPDAVLSRAEAAIGNGDIAGAVSLVAQLPEAGQNAMSAWLSAAKTRSASIRAIKTLSDSLNGN